MIPQKTRRAALPVTYLLAVLLLMTVMLFSVCAGSVAVPVSDTLKTIWNTIWGIPVPEGILHRVLHKYLI